MEKERLEKLAKLVRYYILRMTTKANSGHMTSALSAVEVMVALFFDKLRYDLNNPQNPTNDRVIFSKGHASPLVYALYAAAGVISEKELDDYRQLSSNLEGHPTPRFKYIDVATGSLGQGLSVGLGMALSARKKKLPYIVYVLMGDSEIAEGSFWEAVELTSYYKIGNIVGIVDVNRLGQSGETMLGWNVDSYKKRIEAFGWRTQMVDGHNFGEILKAFDEVDGESDRSQMIIAKTIKGKGVSFLENKEGWHGRALSEKDFEKAVKELGEVDRTIRGEMAKPSSQLTAFGPDGSQARGVNSSQFEASTKKLKINYKIGEEIATRKAYGEALVKLGEINPDIVALDAEVKNSTYVQIFKEKYPNRFYEMFIAEQNMVSVALGMSTRGYLPFVSTFAAFFTRAFDQVRMSGYSRANVKFIGSHAGVSIGEDGPSQMGLEDIAMFRTIQGSVVLCPADAVASAKLVAAMAEHEGICYMRTARPPTPVIYENNEEFKIGGSKVVRSSAQDGLTIVACGVCVVEAIKAADQLAKEGINVRVIDAYSVKPIDEATLRKCAQETNNLIITIEDHYFEGGLGDAVLNVFATNDKVKVYKLAVSKMPMSGKPGELLDWEGISAIGIVKKVEELLG
ncbi:MAG: transketolase [Patescibacteria group bacterium]